MSSPGLSDFTIRFGEFAADLEAGELYRNGTKVRLQGQPFQILTLLLKRPGRIVGREELRRELWPTDTFVDFEHGLNAAVNRLRDAFGDSAENPRFIETLQRRGYRFIYPLDSVPEPEPGSKQRVGPTRMRRIAAVMAVLLAVLTLAITLNVTGLRDRLVRTFNPKGLVDAPRIESIAVLPLANLSGDPEQEYFADGMTEALITELGKISAPRVVSRQSVMQYKGSKKPLQEIARELNVGAVLEGAVERSGDRVRVTVHLQRVSPEGQLWASAYDRSIRDILRLQDEIARNVTDEIQVKLTPQERASLSNARPVDPEAHDFYLRGRYFAGRETDEGYKIAVGYYKKAIEKDPSYAMAYVHLASAYYDSPDGWKETSSLAKAAVSKALELDPSLGEAHVAFCWILLRDFSWVNAEREARLAVTLNPSSAHAHAAYANYLSATGRHSDAIAQMNYAVELDPLDRESEGNLAFIAYRARQYDLAIKVSTRISDNRMLAFAYLRKKMYPEAIEAMEKDISQSGRDNPARLSILALVYGSAGRKQEAQRLIDELTEMAGHRHFSELFFTWAYIGLGDKDKALTWLERAFDAHDEVRLFYLKENPTMDPLRSEPRFQDILRRMNFPQ